MGEFKLKSISMNFPKFSLLRNCGAPRRFKWVYIKSSKLFSDCLCICNYSPINERGRLQTDTSAARALLAKKAGSGE